LIPAEGKGRWSSVSLKPAWSTDRVPGQPGRATQKNPVLENKKKKKEIINNNNNKQERLLLFFHSNIFLPLSSFCLPLFHFKKISELT
jgi:lipopolysaccharide export LptBFGC system permease protein LptF